MGKRGAKPGSEAARRGGLANLAKGREYFAAIGRIGGTRVRDLLGEEHYRAAGRKGGEVTMARHGQAHYARIGAKGGRAHRGTPWHTAEERAMMQQCPHPELARLTYQKDGDTITYCVICGADLERGKDTGA